MPTYEYECDKCGHTFELFQSMSDDPVEICPICKKKSVRRLIFGGVGVIFKGSGFYVTDSKKAQDSGKGQKDSKEKKEAADTGTGAESKKSDVTGADKGKGASVDSNGGSNSGGNSKDSKEKTKKEPAGKP